MSSKLSEGRKKARDLAEQIYYNKIKKECIEQEIDRIKKEYEDSNDLTKLGNIFEDSPRITKQKKPWSRKYLKNVYENIRSGSGSKEDFLYMAEVSENVHKKEKIKKTTGVLASISALITVIIVIIKLLGKN